MLRAWRHIPLVPSKSRSLFGSRPLLDWIRGFSFIFCPTIVTLISITTFRPHTAGLHQAIVSIYWVELFVPPYLLVIGVSQTSLIVGEFWSKALLALWEFKTDPSAVRCGRGRFSCCLIVLIHASGILCPCWCCEGEVLCG